MQFPAELSLCRFAAPHSVHSAFPASENVPGKQGEHEVKSLGQYGSVFGELLSLREIMRRVGHPPDALIAAFKLDCAARESATRAALPRSGLREGADRDGGTACGEVYVCKIFFACGALVPHAARDGRALRARRCAPGFPPNAPPKFLHLA